MVSPANASRRRALLIAKLSSPPASTSLQSARRPVRHPRIDHEPECVVEPVVDVLAALVGQAEPEVEAALRERKLADLEANASPAVPTRPAEAAKIDCVARHERPGVVA